METLPSSAMGDPFGLRASTMKKLLLAAVAALLCVVLWTTSWPVVGDAVGGESVGTKGLRSDGVPPAAVPKVEAADAAGLQPQLPGRVEVVGVHLHIAVVADPSLAEFVATCEVEVTVVDKAGAEHSRVLTVPVPGASTELLGREFVGSELRIAVHETLRHRATERRFLAIAGGADVDCQLELVAHPVVKGVVVDVHGNPAPVAEVRFDAVGLAAPVAADGRFVLGPTRRFELGAGGQDLGTATVAHPNLSAVYVAGPFLSAQGEWSDVLVVCAEFATLSVTDLRKPEDRGRLQLSMHPDSQLWRNLVPQPARDARGNLLFRTDTSLQWQPSETKESEAQGRESTFRKVPAGFVLGLRSEGAEAQDAARHSKDRFSEHTPSHIFYGYVLPDGELVSSRTSGAQQLRLLPNDWAKLRIPPSTVRITGRVHTTDGSPAPGAWVTVALKPKHHNSVMANEEGMYEFEVPPHVPPSARLEVAAFASASQKGSRAPSRAERLRPNLASDTKVVALSHQPLEEHRVDLQLRQALYITGRAVDDRGRPRSTLLVSATREDDGQALAVLLQRSAFGYTDKAGEFEVGPLAPGRYTIRVWASVQSMEGTCATVPFVEAGKSTGDVVCHPPVSREVAVKVADSAAATNLNVLLIPAAVALPTPSKDPLGELQGSGLPLTWWPSVTNLGNGIHGLPVHLELADDGLWTSRPIHVALGAYSVFVQRKDAMDRGLPPTWLGPLEVNENSRELLITLPPHCTVTVPDAPAPTRLRVRTPSGEPVVFALIDGSLHSEVTVHATPLQLLVPIEHPVDVVAIRGGEEFVLASIPAEAASASASW